MTSQAQPSQPNSQSWVTRWFGGVAGAPVSKEHDEEVEDGFNGQQKEESDAPVKPQSATEVFFYDANAQRSRLNPFHYDVDIFARVSQKVNDWNNYSYGGTVDAILKHGFGIDKKTKDVSTRFWSRINMCDFKPGVQVDNVRARIRSQRAVQFCGALSSIKEEHKSLGPTSAAGIAHSNIRLTWVLTRDLTIDCKEMTSKGGNIELYSRRGMALISDIDDTAKVTFTQSSGGMFQSTFIDDPKPAEGMKELYNFIRGAYGQGSPPNRRIPTWWLSFSPLQLWPFIRKFIADSGYPLGEPRLQAMDFKGIEDLMDVKRKMSANTKLYKKKVIEDLLEKWPAMSFICSGDSTQGDPEAYGEIARAHPGRIKFIFIRCVDEKLIVKNGYDQKTRNGKERFEDAFKEFAYKWDGEWKNKSAEPKCIIFKWDNPKDAITQMKEVMPASKARLGDQSNCNCCSLGCGCPKILSRGKKPSSSSEESKVETKPPVASDASSSSAASTASSSSNSKGSWRGR